MNGGYDILKHKAELLDELVETAVNWKRVHLYIKAIDYVPIPIFRKLYDFYEIEKRYKEEK